jgi:acetolactate synthase-1/2/3 large subunit
MSQLAIHEHDAATPAPGADAMKDSSANRAFIDALRQLGVTLYAGVNGGGLIHLAKYLEPLYGVPDDEHRDVPRLFSMSEYLAGFVPLGHYLATGRVAACVTTTGAATKLASSGLSDAKLHNIPAVYVVALNATGSIGASPLQDVSPHGADMVSQLQAELGDACFVIDDPSRLERLLARAQRFLSDSRPVVFAFHPNALHRPLPDPIQLRAAPRASAADFQQLDVERFLKEFPANAAGRRVVIFVGEEAGRAAGITSLTTRLSDLLGAPTVWSVNGAAAVSPDNEYGYGYISFGGNDRALDLWHGLTSDDIVIALGLDPGEYVLDLGQIPAGTVYHFTAWSEQYGHRDGDFRHRCAGEYRLVRGPLTETLGELLLRWEARPPATARQAPAPRSLNTRELPRAVRAGCVDFAALLERLHTLWRPGSIGFDDICMAYKDRQYVTQRPNSAIRFFSAYSGSAMGGAFGMALGAKLGAPELHTFCFSGDGCYRLYGGSLSECARLDLRLFVLNNRGYGLLDQALADIIPDVSPARYHGPLGDIDFVAAARAHGWEGWRLAPDLSNLEEIMDACYTPRQRSMLVDVPVDAAQVLGQNSRAKNLRRQTYL